MNKPNVNVMLLSKRCLNGNSKFSDWDRADSDTPSSNSKEAAEENFELEDEPELSESHLKAINDFDFNKLASNPLPGSLLHKFRSSSRWDSKQMERKLKQSILNPLFSVTVSGSASILTYLICHLVIPHSHALEIAEKVGEAVSQTDRASVEMEMLAKLTGKEFKSRQDIVGVLRSVAARHPWLMNLITRFTS